ncbi:unnamed protein product [Rotaria magnacalcarata]
MSNLEELDLSLLVWMNNTFIDDNLPSNEYIQETLKNFENKKIITSMDYFHENKYSQCHIYSYPYKLKNYYNITNNFRVGIFNSVRRVSLFDERSFEHEFFLRITQSFPFMEKLTLINNKRQNNKQFRKSKKINQDSPIIKYPYLIERDLSKAQKDYYGQFLFDTKTCLPNNIRVNMDYRLVKKVTRNFRRPTTRINCAKIVFVYFLNKSKFPEYLKDFFPRALIC